MFLTKSWSSVGDSLLDNNLYFIEFLELSNHWSLQTFPVEIFKVKNNIVEILTLQVLSLLYFVSFIYIIIYLRLGCCCCSFVVGANYVHHIYVDFLGFYTKPTLNHKIHSFFYKNQVQKLLLQQQKAKGSKINNNDSNNNNNNKIKRGGCKLIPLLQKHFDLVLFSILYTFHSSFMYFLLVRQIGHCFWVGK